MRILLVPLVIALVTVTATAAFAHPGTMVSAHPEGVESSLKVVASIFPLASIVQEIVGDKLTVTTIVPSGADPHHFELTPSSARAIHEADVVFMVGGHFDEWVLGPDIGGKSRPRFVKFSEILRDSLIPLGESFNPHLWLDPLLAKKMAGVVDTILIGMESPNSDYFHARAQAFCSKIDSLHESTLSRLKQSGFTVFVSLHPAWSYFARRYGLNEIDTIEMSHDQEPSVKHIAAVIAKMRKTGTRFILAEEFTNKGLADAVASQTGAEVILLDPMGGSDRPGRDSYLSLIEYNVSLMARAATGTTGD
jgi:zinc transport system substrate-binding protein